MKLIILLLGIINFFQICLAQTSLTNHGSSNQISVDQVGSHIIKGSAGNSAILGGDFNQIEIFQGSPGWGMNQIELNTTGNLNTISIKQARTEFNSLQGSNTNSVSLIIDGSLNIFSSIQYNDVQGQHSIISLISGNNNNANILQKNDGNKTLSLSLTGSNNQIQSLQEGLGAHQSYINLQGNNHTVNLHQTGSGNHSASLNLSNSGGPSTVNLLQQGSTSQTYSLIQTCGISTGCSNSITQGQ